MKKLTPLTAIRKLCINCKETRTEVKNCKFVDCPLFPFRMGIGRVRVRDIRRYCLECMNDSNDAIKTCSNNGKESTLCPLYLYRFGKNPAREGIGNKNANVQANIPIIKKQGNAYQTQTHNAV